MTPTSLNREFEQLTYAVYDPADGTVMAAFRRHDTAINFAWACGYKLMSTIGEWDADKEAES